MESLDFTPTIAAVMALGVSFNFRTASGEGDSPGVFTPFFQSR